MRPSIAMAALAVAALGCTSEARQPVAPVAPAPPVAPAAPAAQAAPAPVSEGAELLGTTPPEWQVEHWINSDPLTLASLRGRVVLVRWFMSPRCPMCSATVPTLRAFDDEYRARGLSVIGMYHHKDPEPLDPKAVEAFVHGTFAIRFPVAIDPDWRTLKAWWLTGHERTYTSVSFLLDRKGAIRFIHPGGKYAPESDDARVMRSQIEALLAEK